MPKSPGQSEFIYKSPEVDREQDMVEHGASTSSTKWVFVVMAVLLVALFVLIAFALHVPAGESAP